MMKVIAIVGPTATGKTAASIHLAQKFDGEIISCDSMQVYRGLNIGTAKATAEEQMAAKHHLIDILDVDESYSVADFVERAESVIAEMSLRGKLPIIAGGTGLYARSLLQSADFSENSRNDLVRNELEEKAKTDVNALYERLKEIDPYTAERLHPNNVKRLVRALEYYEVTGRSISSQIEVTQTTEKKYDYLMLCLVYRDREKLYEKINQRVDEMFEDGLIEEAKEIYESLNSKEETASQAIGYKELFECFEGRATLEAAREKIKQGTRRYAKRQMTWFRKESSIEFVYVDDFCDKEKMLAFIDERVGAFLKEK